MPRSLSFQKRSCTVCGTPSPPPALHRISDRHHDICTSCIDFLRKNSGGLNPDDPETPPLPQHLPHILEEEGESFPAAVNHWAHEVKLTGWIVEGLRVGSYLSALFLIIPGTALYPIMQGAILGDLVTWLMFSVCELPFRGIMFGIEFLVYGGIFTLYSIQKGGAIPMPEGPSDFAMLSLAFLTMATAKITWWMLKVFVIQED